MKGIFEDYVEIIGLVRDFFSLDFFPISFLFFILCVGLGICLGLRSIDQLMVDSVIQPLLSLLTIPKLCLGKKLQHYEIYHSIFLTTLLQPSIVQFFFFFAYFLIVSAYSLGPGLFWSKLLYEK